MARGINKVILIGNLGNEPEIMATGSGTIIATLSIATSESWKDRKTGQQQNKTEWHRVVIFGKLAEIAQQYLHKGSKVYLEGKLQTRKWQGQDGQDHYTTEVVVDGFSGQLQMFDSRQDNIHNANAFTPSSNPASYKNSQSSVPPQPPASQKPIDNNASTASELEYSGGIATFDDDIPF